MQRINAEPTFTDAAVADLGGPRTARFLQTCQDLVPWPELVETLRPLFPEHGDKGGRPFWPALVMIKCVMLQKWFNLSDPQLEEQLKDRISFRRFVGLSQADRTPDETTFVVFRRRLREAKLDQTIFDVVLRHIDAQGLLVRNGTIVDATIIEQSRGKKTGEQDEDGNDLTTRDPEAGFTRKHGRKYHGYKMHTATDPSGD